MLKKLSRVFELIFLSSVKSAVFYLAVWLGATELLFVLSNYIISNTFVFMLFFLILYPVYTFVLCFMYAKRNGLKWYMPLVMLAIVVVAFVISEGYRSIVPNIIVMSVLCTGFGSGLGNVFADKEMLKARKLEYSTKKNHEDKKYKKILDD